MFVLTLNDLENTIMTYVILSHIYEEKEDFYVLRIGRRRVASSTQVIK